MKLTKFCDLQRSDFLSDCWLAQLGGLNCSAHIFELLGREPCHELVRSADGRDSLDVLGDVADSVVSVQIQLDLGAVVQTDAHYSSGLAGVHHGLILRGGGVHSLGHDRSLSVAAHAHTFPGPGVVRWWGLLEIFFASVLQANRHRSVELLLELTRHDSLLDILHEFFGAGSVIVTEL